MPKGNPKTPKTKSDVERYYKDKWITENQYKSLTWNHLRQIGEWNQKKQHKPKSVAEWKKKHPNKSHAEWQKGKKGKRNMIYKRNNDRNKNDTT